MVTPPGTYVPRLAAGTDSEPSSLHAVLSRARGLKHARRPENRAQVSRGDASTGPRRPREDEDRPDAAVGPEPLEERMADSNAGLSKTERDAVKQRAAELRAQEKAGKSRAAGEKAVREAIDAMPEADRILAEGIDRIVTEVAPHLLPKTWYGFPAYTDAAGKVVVFFKAAAKYESRYATLGFEEAAQLDDGSMWATSFALTAWTDEVAQRITDHVRRAAG